MTIYFDDIMEILKRKHQRMVTHHRIVKSQLVPDNVLNSLSKGLKIIKTEGRYRQLPRFLTKVEHVARQHKVGISWLFERIM